MVKEKKHWAFIDKTGAKVIQTRYEDVDPFDGGLAEVRREVKSGSLGGFLFSAVTFAARIPTFGVNVDLIDEKIKRGYIDRTGTEVISAKNDYNSVFHDGVALVRVKGKWGAVDRTGAYVIEPKYSAINFFSEDLAAVKEGEKWGYVARDGRIVIAPAYDEARDFREGLAAVTKGGKSFYIDKTGHVPFLVPSTITEVGDFSMGLAPAKIGGKWGFIDHTGAVIIAPAYAEARTVWVSKDTLNAR